MSLETWKSNRRLKRRSWGNSSKVKWYFSKVLNHRNVLSCLPCKPTEEKQRWAGSVDLCKDMRRWNKRMRRLENGKSLGMTKKLAFYVDIWKRITSALVKVFIVVQVVESHWRSWNSDGCIIPLSRMVPRVESVGLKPGGTLRSNYSRVRSRFRQWFWVLGGVSSLKTNENVVISWINLGGLWYCGLFTKNFPDLTPVILAFRDPFLFHAFVHFFPSAWISLSLFSAQIST